MTSMSMRQMLEAGVHFGHQTRFWNPKMAPFIFGERNRIHIINLEKTLPLYNEAAGFVADAGRRRRQGALRRHQALGARGDRQGSGALRHALRQPSLARRHAHQLQDHPSVDPAPERNRRDDRRAARSSQRSKREAQMLRREREKLDRSLGGIKDMDGLPDALFVVDVGSREDRDPRGPEARHPGGRGRRHQLLAGRHQLRDPGNDDAMRAIQLYAAGIADAVLEGHVDDAGSRRSARTNSSSSTRKASRVPKGARERRAAARRPARRPPAPSAASPAASEAGAERRAARRGTGRGGSGGERGGVHGAPCSGAQEGDRRGCGATPAAPARRDRRPDAADAARARDHGRHGRSRQGAA